MFALTFSSRPRIIASCELVCSRMPPVSPTRIIDRYRGLKTSLCSPIASDSDMPPLTALVRCSNIRCMPGLRCCLRSSSRQLSNGSPARTAVLNCVVIA